MPELDAERRERLAEALVDAPLSWDFFPDPDAAIEMVTGALAPLVAGWLADDTAVCTTCQHRGGDDQPAQHPGCAAALGRIRSAALREAADAWTQGEWTQARPAHGHLGWAQSTADWLRDRADRIGGAS